MPAALKWRNKILLAKIETTYGVDAVPVAATNGILATDVKLQPMEGTDVSRDLDLPYFGAQGTIPNELNAKLSFKVELAPSGSAGTVPGWGPLLRACGGPLAFSRWPLAFGLSLLISMISILPE